MTEAVSSNPETDRRLMAVALSLGRRNLGRTFPNPAVGALVVRQQASGPLILARGWTGEGGRPHAERFALEAAGEAARGATLYVTLEPCSHTGQTPPCIEAIIAAGVGRVVTAVQDPDPRVAGRGHAALSAAGIEVTSGVLGELARRAHSGHITRVTKGRPQVTLKLAISADGMIGTRGAGRMNISGPEAFAEVHTMRAETDAVMIGSGTMTADDPLLTVRLPGLAQRSPIRIVLDTQARLKPRSRLVQTARDIPLWVVVGPEATDDCKVELTKAGAEIIEVGSGSGGLALPALLTTLAERGLTRILVEGGAKLASSLVSAGLVDEVVLFRAPVVVGPDGVRALDGQALSAIERSPRYRLVEDAKLGADRKLRYVKVD